MNIRRKSQALRILENMPLGFDPLVLTVLFKAWRD